MFNCLILGSGRSGTSMMGGILHESGYFMGDNLYPGRESNVKGFFENAQINGINEDILRHYCKNESIDNVEMDTLANGQFWLMSLSENINININDMDKTCENRIKQMIKPTPFAYKDPRFSYTLPIWKHYLPADTKFIVMFRRPDITVSSILKECSQMPYLRSLKINKAYAYKVWNQFYKHILNHYAGDTENFIFVHYNQVLTGSSIERIGKHLNKTLSHEFVDKKLNRSIGDMKVNYESKVLYSKLCELAEYQDV